ncbi:hypothetical protein CFP56_027126 [Quercus suber]|uniref:Uncharacterized protein n=1 Tax=Quercus suber TaxID=58331 RepID=A0AAW0JXK3_QUESU
MVSKRRREVFMITVQPLVMLTVEIFAGITVDCLGYYRYEGTGCRYWEGNLTFVPDNGISRSRVLKYVLTKEDTSNKG